jgi:hypothetical protein
MSRPIRPEDIADLQPFPAEVIDAFNAMIAKAYSNGVATFTQGAVVACMVEKGIAAKDILPNNWLNVEEQYRASGWVVSYDKPGYNESYQPTFTFKKKP